MIKEKKTTASEDTADASKQPQNFRFTSETIRKLEKAAREYGMSKTAYAELALKDRFKKDNIT
jgi:TraY domain-containing protein